MGRESSKSSDNSGTTLMMRQYLSIKAEHSDCLLFYRMGDFYELFFDDAVRASAALSIALTKRGRHEGNDIQMCGVPVHSADSYLARLIKQGFRVAICEQVESADEAKKRGYKAVVKREVVRIITSGTLTEENLLSSGDNNFLLSLSFIQGCCGAAWADISTGEFYVQNLSLEELPSLLERVGAVEIIMGQSLYDKQFSGSSEYQEVISVQSDARFDSLNGEHRLQSYFSIGKSDVFGDFSRCEYASAGALLDYITLTQVQSRVNINPPQRILLSDYLEIDAATRRNLEINRTLGGDRKGSLLWTINRCVTPLGMRLLSLRLNNPLSDIVKINYRLDQVGWFVERVEVREQVRDLLKSLPDLQRLMGKISVERCIARDLAALCSGLQLVPSVRSVIQHAVNSGVDGVGEHLWQRLCDNLGCHDELCNSLSSALADDLPSHMRDGGFIRQGYSAALDDVRRTRDEGHRLLSLLESRYRKETGVDNLKIKHNNILGYYIEVTSKNASRMGDNFVHRQTMVNAVRYTSVELSDLAREIVESFGSALAVEMEIFAELLSAIKSRSGEIHLSSESFGELDVAVGLAQLASDNGYSRAIVGDGLDFFVRGGRHPVVEKALQVQGAEFIGNDCDLSRGQYLWLLTGPNMAGKSTYLRQNALLVILAQMGSFVPAVEFRFGYVDRLFSRVGAADDLARGRSTFMVEMVETAVILHRASERSLVILDEIGRGTATYDGLSIAWSCIEYLHERLRPRTLFATHYHELTELRVSLSCLAVRAMEVREWDGDVIFLHNVIEGCADKSYGIHVARLAGLPEDVTQRAQMILSKIEDSSEQAILLRDVLGGGGGASGKSKSKSKGKGKGKSKGSGKVKGGDVRESGHDNLFDSVGALVISPLEQSITDIEADNLSPREALDFIYHLKKMVSS